MSDYNPDLTYRIGHELGNRVLLETFYKGSYIGQSIGYYSRDHKRIEIYPYKLNGRYPTLNLRTMRYQHELQ